MWTTLILLPVCCSFFIVSCAAGRIGIMFLNEVVLGKEYQVGVGNGGYVAAPKGYDSIVAKGHTEPGTTYCALSTRISGDDLIILVFNELNSLW